MPRPAKTKTKVIRYLLIDALARKRLTYKDLAERAGLHETSIYNLINCRRDGEIAIWKKIQEALSLKDSEMWSIINTTKRVYR